MSKLTVTPINTYTADNESSIHLEVYNWYCGKHFYGNPGFYTVRVEPLYGDFNWYRSQYMHPCVEETIESLYEQNRILLVAQDNYTGNTSLFGYKSQNIVRLSSIISNIDAHVNDQILVSFDVMALRRTDVQLFVGVSHVNTLEVYNRSKKMIVIPVRNSRNWFYLRPAKNEIYLYGVEYELI